MDNLPDHSGIGDAGQVADEQERCCPPPKDLDSGQKLDEGQSGEEPTAKHRDKLNLIVAVVVVAARVVAAAAYNNIVAVADSVHVVAAALNQIRIIFGGVSFFLRRECWLSDSRRLTVLQRFAQYRVDKDYTCTIQDFC